MKRISMILIVLANVIVATAQIQLEYNRKGDEAMKSLDYSSAKIWYEDGVVENCDPHSIKQLAIIWLADKTMHNDMRRVMGLCLNCLEHRAEQYKDTTSMNMLIQFYEVGIGTAKNDELAEFWKQQLAELRNPNPVYNGQNGIRPPREKNQMQFFAGYSASLAAPFGLTVGGVGRAVGWYLRFRSSLSFQDYEYDCDEKGNIIGGLGNSFHQPLNIRKTNTLMGTGGMVVKAHPSFYISFGGGYCSHEVLYKFKKIGEIEAVPEGDFWAKLEQTSFTGVALDLDGTFKLGKSFYGTMGCSILRFQYVYANVGIGLFF